MRKNERHHILNLEVYTGKSRRGTCVIESTLYTNEKNHLVFTQSVAKGTGVLGLATCQAQDTILQANPYLTKSGVFRELYRLWKTWHLNDMHAGTAAQEAALAKAKAQGLPINDYTTACAYLKQLNLYEVQYRGKPYCYGHSWLYRPISQKDLAIIENFIKQGTNKVTYMFDGLGNLQIKEK